MRPWELCHRGRLAVFQTGATHIHRVQAHKAPVVANECLARLVQLLHGDVAVVG